MSVTMQTKQITPLNFDVDTYKALSEISLFAQQIKGKSSATNNYKFGCVHFDLIITTNQTAIKDGRFLPYIQQIESVGWQILPNHTDTSTKGVIKYFFCQSIDTQPWLDFVKEHTLKQLASTYNYIEKKVREIENKHSLSAMSLQTDQDVYRISHALRVYEGAMMKHHRLEKLLKKISSLKKINKISVPHVLLDLYSDLKVENEREDRVMLMDHPLSIIKWCVGCLLDPTHKELP